MPKSHLIELQSMKYGHFGTPAYDPGTKTWTFGRILGDKSRLEPLGEAQELLPATIDTQDVSCLRQDVDYREERYDRALHAETRGIMNGFPQLQPAEAFVEPMVRLSEAISQAIDEYDPSKGDLIATGSVTCNGEPGKRIIKLLALPGGSCGESLRLSRLRTDNYESNDGKFELDVPSEEVGSWTGKGAPILQVCFAESAGTPASNTLLAVRFQSCTIIMFPRYRPKPVPAAIGSEYTYQQSPSRIDCNVLFEITAEETRNTQHANVAFNPWNQREFAIIDPAGQWTTFAVVRKPGRCPVYHSKLLRTGEIPPRMTEEEKADLVYEAQDDGAVDGFLSNTKSRIENRTAHIPTAMEMDLARKVMSGQPSISSCYDGWARITYAMDGTVVVACTRREIALFSTARGVLFEFPELLSNDNRPIGWHLDLRRCPGHPELLFILTSNAVFLVRILEKSPRAFAGVIALSALHFRGQKDISMKMNVTTMGSGVMVSIYSHYNPAVTCLQFQLPVGKLDSATVSQPFDLRLPKTADGKSAKILDVEIQEVIRVHVSAPSSSPSSNEHRLPLCNLQILQRNLALQRIFVRESRPDFDATSAAPIRARMAISKESSIDTMTEFVVDSTEETEEDASSILDGVGARDTDDYGQDIILETPEQAMERRKRKPHHRHIVRAIESPSLAGDELLPTFDILDLASRIQNVVLEREIQANECARTLFEHVDNVVPRVDDLRSASFAVEDALGTAVRANQGTGELGIVVKSYPNAPFLPAPDDVFSQMTLHEVHEHIVDHYIKPLSEEFPETFLKGREGIAKSVAAEIMLASSRIEIVGSPLDTQELEDEDVEMEDVPPESLSRGRSGSRPRWGSGPTVSSQIDSQGLPRTSLLIPSPSRRSTPSRSQSPYAAPPADSMKPIIARLRRNVGLPTIPQKWELRPMVLLSHWDVGADPHKYSYADTRIQLTEERDFEKMTDKERKAFLRKRERSRIRKEREARKTDRLTQESSQLPMIQSSQQLPVIQSSQVGWGQAGGGVGEDLGLDEEEAGPSQLTLRPLPLVGSSQIVKQRPAAIVQSSQFMPSQGASSQARKKKRPKRTEGF